MNELRADRTLEQSRSIPHPIDFDPDTIILYPNAVSESDTSGGHFEPAGEAFPPDDGDASVGNVFGDTEILRKRKELAELDERHAKAMAGLFRLDDADVHRFADELKAASAEIDRLAARKAELEVDLELDRGTIVISERPRSVFGSIVDYLGKWDRRLDRRIRSRFRWMKTALGVGVSAEEDDHAGGVSADSFRLRGSSRRDPNLVIDAHHIRGGEKLSLEPERPKVTGWGALDGKSSEMRYTGSVSGENNQYHNPMSMEDGFSLQDVPKPEPKGWGAIDQSAQSGDSREKTDPWAFVESTPEQRAHMPAGEGRGMDVASTGAGVALLDAAIRINPDGTIPFESASSDMEMTDAEREILAERNPLRRDSENTDYLADVMKKQDEAWYLRVQELIPKLTDADPAARAAAKAEIVAIRAAEKERHNGAAIH